MFDATDPSQTTPPSAIVQDDAMSSQLTVDAHGTTAVFFASTRRVRWAGTSRSPTRPGASFATRISPPAWRSMAAPPSRLEEAPTQATSPTVACRARRHPLSAPAATALSEIPAGAMPRLWCRQARWQPGSSSGCGAGAGAGGIARMACPQRVAAFRCFGVSVWVGSGRAIAKNNLRSDPIFVRSPK